MSNEVLDDKSTKVLTSEISIDKNIAIYPFNKTSLDKVKTSVEELMLNSGYKMENGNNGIQFYTRGSQVLRLLFGAFAKYFKWKISYNTEGDSIRLVFEKDAKGYAGGVIGVNQVNNEFKKITGALTGLYTELEG